MVRHDSEPRTFGASRERRSEACAQVLGHLRDIRHPSKPAANLSDAQAALIEQLDEMDPELLRHPEFISALIRKVDDIPRDNAEAVKDVLVLASGAKYILDEKNLQHVVSVSKAQSNKRRSDNIIQTENLRRGTQQNQFIRDHATFDEDCFPSNDANVNRRICYAGRRIYFNVVEPLRDNNIKFGHPHFLSTSNSPGIEKGYSGLVMWQTHDAAICTRLESMHQRGLDAVRRDDKHKYYAVLPETDFLKKKMNGDYIGVDDDMIPLLTRGMERYEGSMLSFELTTVPLSSWITPEGGSFTLESMTSIHDIVLQNQHVKSHMSQFLAATDASHTPPTQPPLRRSQNDTTSKHNRTLSETSLEHSRSADDPTPPWDTRSKPTARSKSPELQSAHLAPGSAPQSLKISGTSRLPDKALGNPPSTKHATRKTPKPREHRNRRDSVLETTRERHPDDITSGRKPLSYGDVYSNIRSPAPHYNDETTKLPSTHSAQLSGQKIEPFETKATVYDGQPRQKRAKHKHTKK